MHCKRCDTSISPRDVNLLMTTYWYPPEDGWNGRLYMREVYYPVEGRFDHVYNIGTPTGEVYFCANCMSNSEKLYFSWALHGGLPPSSISIQLGRRNRTPIANPETLRPDGKPCRCNFCSGERARPRV